MGAGCDRSFQLSKLGLNIHVGASLHTTRLKNFRMSAIDRRERGAQHGEPICQVRCQRCRRLALFRLDLRETAREGHRIFRIPGLCYSVTMENGVGLVLDEGGRITGRMLYGTPACDCGPDMLQRVEIH